MKKVAIVGTVGIPARYGGFETLTDNLTRILGREVQFTVYCSSRIYDQKLSTYNNATLKYVPLEGNGYQSIIYDIVSLFHAARTHDTILILGVSGCLILPLFRLLYPRVKLLTNIDGLEHKREKWKGWVKRYLRYSEKLAVRHSDLIIADNRAIQDYVRREYRVESRFIAYAGDHVERLPLGEDVKRKYGLADRYAFKVSRIEPENNIRMVLEAFSQCDYPLVMVGNWDYSKYGQALKREYGHCPNITLLDPIYNQSCLNQLRSNCSHYIHGHSAGGTNPALLEAMNLGLPVFTFDCPYNRATTHNEAIFFRDANHLRHLIHDTPEAKLQTLAQRMYSLARENYTWDKISQEYRALFDQYAGKTRKEARAAGQAKKAKAS